MSSLFKQSAFKKSLCAIAITSVFSPSFAKDAATIVVTATRQEQRANELLSDVTVITREDIEQAGPSSSLGDLLGRQPGVQVVANGGAGSNVNVLLRGTNAGHTLILLDGLRINSATLGETSLSRIPLSQVDHVEILRGPASSLYGSEAIGGVIQIFTRRGEGKPHVTAEASYGSYDTSDVNVGVSGATGAFSYSLNADTFHTRGFNSIRNPSNAAFNADKDGYRNDSVTGSAGFKVAAGHEFGASFFYSDGRNKYDGGFSPATAQTNYENGIKVSAYSAYTRNQILPQWTSTLRIGRSADDATNYEDNVDASIFKTAQNQVSWQNDISLPVGKALLAVESTKQTVSGSSVFTVSDRRLDAYLAGWSGHFGDNRLQLNVRRDKNTQFGGKTTGLAAYGYQFSPALRASISTGTAIKVPTFNDLYFPNTPFVGSGNPNLSPEFARNKEVAVHYEGGVHKASATYYHNRVSNLIQWEEQPPVGSFFYSPQNVSAAKLEGVTLSYEGLFGGYTLKTSLDFLDARDLSTDNWLVRRARAQGSLALSRTQGLWSWNTEVQAVGHRYNDVDNLQRLGGYGLLNLSGSYKFQPDWALFARLNNVFDRRYEQSTDYATAGTNVFVGVRYSPK